MPTLASLAQSAAPLHTDFWSARFVTESAERLVVRNDVAESPSRERDTGVMVCVQHPGESDDATADAPISHWPDGGDTQPRPSVVAVWKSA